MLMAQTDASETTNAKVTEPVPEGMGVDGALATATAHQDAISTSLKTHWAQTDAAKTASAKEPEPAPEGNTAKETVNANPSPWSKWTKSKPSLMSLRKSLRN